MANNIVDIEAIDNVSNNLFSGVSNIIDYARQEVVVYVNKHANMMFWHIGKYINEDMGYKRYSAYGSKILATLSQRLTERYGKGYTYSAQYLTCLPDKQWFIDKLNRAILIAKEYSETDSTNMSNKD